MATGPPTARLVRIACVVLSLVLGCREQPPSDRAIPSASADASPVPAEPPSSPSAQAPPMPAPSEIETDASLTGGRGDGISLGPGEPGPEPRRPSPSVRSRVIDIKGRLSAKTAEDALRRQSGRSLLCYERALESAPNLAGRVTTRFVVDEWGAILSIERVSTTLAAPDFLACIDHVLAGLAFFPEKDRGVSTVRAELVFAPPPRPGKSPP